ncbi:MAG: helix-turn-helix transcriptional regulator [Clostridia bacterium]|nr:helix-turn-helix transcriptional regulator [Clostridia bacterium]
MVGERIKNLRMSFNLTQPEFAKRLKISKQCVSNWENGYIQPSVDMVMRIADFFNVSTDFLLGRDNKNTIDVDGLSIEEVAHIKLIISDILKRK